MGQYASRSRKYQSNHKLLESRPSPVHGATPEPTAAPGMWRVGIYEVKGSIFSGQSSTRLVLPPMEGFVFFHVHGDVFPPMHPYPEPWDKSCMIRSCPVVGSLFLTIHYSSWIPAEQLQSTCQPGTLEIRTLTSQSKEVDIEPAFIFKSPLLECNPSTSLQGPFHR